MQQKKFSLTQDETNMLREELRRLKKELRGQKSVLEETSQEIKTRECIQQRHIKQRDAIINQMACEIDNLKQERDAYKDRLQRSLRESQHQREQLERSISNQSTQNIIQNIRGMGSLATNNFHHN